MKTQIVLIGNSAFALLADTSGPPVLTGHGLPGDVESRDMRSPWPKFLHVAAILLVASSLQAAPKAAPTPPLKAKPDSISAVSADSITVQHSKVKMSTKKGEASSLVTSSKTYKITKQTQIQINDMNSTVDKLQTGMLVTVAADPPSDTDKNIAGVATEISAHAPKAASK